MASKDDSATEASQLDKSLTCSICMDVFSEPVTTLCGHTFCQKCLQGTFQYNDHACPLCKQYLTKTPQVSIILRDIISQLKSSQEQKGNEFSGKPGEVACDICTEPKRNSKKSCLVCLFSYCSAHLEKHLTTKRLKGHKLVEPVENLDERACVKHCRPLDLYSRAEQRCICTLCMRDGLEDVVSIEEEWSKRKEKNEQVKTELEQKLKSRQRNVEDIKISSDFCQVGLDDERHDIEVIFSAAVGLVEEAQKKVLQPMNERKQVLQKEAQAITDGFEADIRRLEKAIADLDDIHSLEDPFQFLQTYPSLHELESMEADIKVSLDTSVSFGTMRKTTMLMQKQIELEMERLTAFELTRIQAFAVDVQLDLKSSHKHLMVSKDGKEVRDGGEEQDREDMPERFDLFASVLGVNALSGGKAYWEVDVGDKTGWDLGVTSITAERKGKLSLNPEGGYWVMVHHEGDKYAAMTSPPTILALKQKPTRVGVFVDQDDGVVSFYNLTAKSHMFSFDECSFSEQLLPYLSPHLRHKDQNTAPLKICTVVNHNLKRVI